MQAHLTKWCRLEYLELLRRISFKKSWLNLVSSAYLLDHRKSKGIWEKNIYFCFIDYAKACDCVDHNKLWKILKEMGLPEQLTCLLRNLYAGQETTVRTGHGTTDWFQIWKEVHQGCICHPAYLTYIQSTLGEMLVLTNHKLESRLPGEITTSDMQLILP